MADATQFTFSWAEITEILIKKQDLHEGEWMAGIEFTLNIGFMGATPAEARPGLMTLANSLQLTRAQPGAPPHMIVDAAKVNPKA
jgi:hypothetical protein